MVDDALLNGDMHLLEEIFGMLKSFVPKEVAQEAESAIASLDREMEGPKDNDSESQGDMIDVLEDLIKQEDFADECKKMVSEIKPEIEAVEGEIAEKIRKKDDKVFCYYYWMLFDNAQRRQSRYSPITSRKRRSTMSGDGFSNKSLRL